MIRPRKSRFGTSIRFVTVDWILGNDYLGSDNPDDPTDPNMFPLGGIDLDLAEFKIQGVTAVEPYLADLHAIGARESRSGWEHFPVMSDTFICDGQTRRCGLGNIASHGPMSPDDALRHGENWLGAGYWKMGSPGSGVFRSADGTRQFRITSADLDGAHGSMGPHVHFEALNRSGLVVENLHIPLR